MLTLQTLEEAGNGRVLIVDGQASKRCALFGDLLAAMMHRNGWAVSLSASCINRKIFYLDVINDVNFFCQLSQP